jgi:hypothetical protein
MVVVDMCFVCLLHPGTPLCGGLNWAWTSVITTMHVWLHVNGTRGLGSFYLKKLNPV